MISGRKMDRGGTSGMHPDRALGELLEDTGRSDEAQLHHRAAQELESGLRRPRAELR